jgi:hypothetical protein
MHGRANFYTVWCHRSAKSIFGPVNRNGQILCFETEEQARVECDRLNATRSGSHVHYGVECAHDLPLETGLAALADGFRRLAGEMAARR